MPSASPGAELLTNGEHRATIFRHVARSLVTSRGCPNPGTGSVAQGASQFIAGILNSAWTISDGNELEGGPFPSSRDEGTGIPARNPLFQRALILRSGKGSDDLLRLGIAPKTTRYALAVYRNTLAVYRLSPGGLSLERRCL